MKDRELYDVLTIEGYEQLKSIYNQLGQEDKEMYRSDFECLKKILKQKSKELEVLKTLKIRYSQEIKRKNDNIVNDMDLVDARDIRVKEWLEK